MSTVITALTNIANIQLNEEEIAAKQADYDLRLALSISNRLREGNMDGLKELIPHIHDFLSSNGQIDGGNTHIVGIRLDNKKTIAVDAKDPGIYPKQNLLTRIFSKKKIPTDVTLEITGHGLIQAMVDRAQSILHAHGDSLNCNFINAPPIIVDESTIRTTVEHIQKNGMDVVCDDKYDHRRESRYELNLIPTSTVSAEGQAGNPNVKG